MVFVEGVEGLCRGGMSFRIPGFRVHFFLELHMPGGASGAR